MSYVICLIMRSCMAVVHAGRGCLSLCRRGSGDGYQRTLDGIDALRHTRTLAHLPSPLAPRPLLESRSKEGV
ncbi:hypothetical protein BC628DRAFT_270033 [Trametes gibbosa]|nr:hypothetical protein BC628DRAFT_270033 [Trametes gibbosa]